MIDLVVLLVDNYSVVVVDLEAATFRSPFNLRI